MDLKELLVKKRSPILKKWFRGIIETYPQDTAKFLRTQKDPFANPVGSTIFEGIEGIFESLLKGLDPAKSSPFLSRIIQIRAVQDFFPSQAIGFVFLLKKVITEELGKEIKEQNLFSELIDFEDMIDQLALLSFDQYMHHREKIFEIKVNEIHHRTVNVLERANLVKPKDTFGSQS